MREDSKYWIALSMINGVGIVLTRSLLQEFKSVEDIFKAPKKNLAQVEGIGTKNAEAIANFEDWNLVEKEIAKIEKLGIKLFTFKDAGFPKSLYRTYNPPPLLYVKGNILEQDVLSIAIVGSRLPDRYGRACGNGGHDCKRACPRY